MFVIEGEQNRARVFAPALEDGAIAQIKTLCDQDFFAGSQICIMPDAHAGAGCTIGTTMTIHGVIVPNLVGVDISCGVEAVNVGPDPVNFEQLDQIIRQRVPSGAAVRREPHAYAEQINLNDLTCASVIPMDRAIRSLGSLGGGNHFIELDRDENGDHWLIVHSGSRGPGLQAAEHHQKIAQGLHPEAPKDLAWLAGEYFDAYVHDMRIMQRYADLNRKAMLAEIMGGMGWEEKDRVTTVHNYLDTETHILRKGAVSAEEGQLLLIPLNMRDGALLCRGKGNADWNRSAPHGAGRLLSRMGAKKKLNMEDFRAAMEGIYTTSINEYTLDEAPGAYKEAGYIMDNVGDTVDIINIMKPVYNFKATEKPKDFWRRKKVKKTEYCC